LHALINTVFEDAAHHSDHVCLLANVCVINDHIAQLVYSYFVQGNSDQAPNYRGCCDFAVAAISRLQAMVKAATWRPLDVRSKLCISGGFSAPSKAHVLDTRVIMKGNRDITFVQVGTSISWLCEVAAQQHATRRPLARVGVFESLRKAACGSAVAVDSLACGSAVAVDSLAAHDKMDDFALDDDPAVEDDAPPSAKKPRRCKLPAKMRGPLVVELFAHDYSASAKDFRVVEGRPEQPAVAGANSEHLAVAGSGLERRFFVAVDGVKLYIEVSALAWLVTYVKAELESGGVRPIAVADADSPKSCISWDFRDECWVFRSRAGGSSTRKSKPVRSLMAAGKPYAHLKFEDARQAARADFAAECGE
jgi:hypothetical protein